MFPIFELENYLLRHEAKASLSLCASGVEAVRLPHLLAMADSESQTLWETLSLDYAQPQGLPRLNAEIAHQYDAVDATQIVVFAGAAEAILCTMQGLLHGVDHAIVVTPCYQSLVSVPATLCQTTTVPLDETNGWRLDLQRIEDAILPQTRLIVINFPNNPTGALPDRDTFERLIQLARRHGLYLFADEVYRLLELNPADRLPAAVDAYERGISISSLSKAHGLPGLRIGWLACRDESVIQRAIAQKHYTSICPNTPSEILALMALRAQETLLKENRLGLLENRAILNRFMEAHGDSLEWTLPHGGCLGFPRLLTGEPVERFALRLLDETGVLILPGTLYQWPGQRFRISYARKTLAKGLARLEANLRPLSV